MMLVIIGNLGMIQGIQEDTGSLYENAMPSDKMTGFCYPGGPGTYPSMDNRGRLETEKLCWLHSDNSELEKLDAAVNCHHHAEHETVATWAVNTRAEIRRVLKTLCHSTAAQRALRSMLLHVAWCVVPQ
jgi:hypothetical protein